MADAHGNDCSRRDFLRLGWTLAAGVALPPVLTSCLGGGGDGTPLPPETFVDPQVLSSVDGKLELTLNLAYLTTRLDGKQVTLRNWFGTIPAPTLRVNAGDTLRIRLVNNLPANPPSTEPVKHLRYPNSTNLHTHGLHVTPGLVSPGVYGDYVMDDPSLGVQPGETRQHEYQIGAEHPPGAYWYHPHMHGSSAMQVGSGMAGALLVKGAVDRVPEIAAARERVFMFQAPIVDASGMLEDFVQVADNGGLAASDNSIPTGEPPFLVNGVRRPRLLMYRGEVQNWHFVNAGIFKFLNLALDGHALHLYSLDGNGRSRPKSVGPIVPDPASFTQEGVVLAPGNRASVLVQAGAPGTYRLRTLNFPIGGPPPGKTNPGAKLLEDVVAEIVVLDVPKPMALPAGTLPVSPALAPITDHELAAAGGLARAIVFRAVTNPNNTPPFLPRKFPITQPPASLVVHPGDELDDWVFQATNPQGEPNTLSDTVLGIGITSEAASPKPVVPGEFTEVIPFQSARAKRQVVTLGSVEEWTVYNMNNIRHPFHIHVNPCWVVAVSDKPGMEPYWADTIALPPGNAENPGFVTFRSRFVDFRGQYVMHCHMLAHEDMGMMQMVEVV